MTQPHEPPPKNETSVSADLDLSRATPELIAALVAAQQQVETVGKDGTNTSGRGYKYASAENMIRGARAAMKDHGLAILSTWSSVPVDSQPGDIGNQFVCATVTESFALLHEGGGMITGRAVLDAIGSKMRPTDKAVAATITYMHGFLLRHLLNMDRAEEGDHAVDGRDESDGFRPPQRQQPAPARARTGNQAQAGKLDGLRQAVSERMAELFKRDPLWDARMTTEGEAVTRAALFKSLDVPTAGRLSATHLRTVKDFLDQRLAVLEQDARAEEGDDEPPHDPDTGEISEPPEPYEPADGQGSLVPEEATS